MQSEFHENFIENYDKYLPLEAYLYFPKKEEIKFGEEKKGYRRIYEGQIQFDIWELDILNEFQKFLIKNKYKTISWWNDSNILRFLYANKFKFEKTFKSIQAHSEWRQTKLPAKFTINIQNFLKSGVLYIHGRDHRFRPIIVFKPYKLSLKETDIDIIMDSLTYLLQYTIENLMLPGQVENWNFIIDLNSMGISSLPLSLLKKVLSNMTHNFRSRLFQMYMINSPKSINMVWGMIKGFLEEQTVQKINIIAASIPENLFSHTHVSQVEIVYGGISPNLTENYWPPYFPSKTFFLNNEVKDNILITREKYVELFEQGFLKRNVICRDLIELKNSTSIIKSTNIPEEVDTPNPDPEIILKNVKEQESGIQIEKTENFTMAKNEEKKNSKTKTHKKKTQNNNNNNINHHHHSSNLWSDLSMEIEEEKNNIKTLSENKFKMKSFLDAKYEFSIKGMY